MVAQPPHCPQICPQGLCAGWQRQAGGDGVEGDRVSKRIGSRDGEEPSATRMVLAGEQRWVTSLQINLG